VVVVDPGDAAPVLAHLQKQQLHLTEIWLTHHHHDHVGGIAALVQAFPEVIIRGHQALNMVNQVCQGQDKFKALDLNISVWDVPGHTATHQTYLLDDTERLHVFCGDTLFSAGCGRVFDGTMADLHQSLSRLATLPDNTLFYPAHEYTVSNLQFAQAVEPENEAIALALCQNSHRSITLPVTLAHEKQINPFLRVTVQEVITAVSKQNYPCTNALAVFSGLRTWKNHF
jgi:hydroxyacylglutathione hydrolase